MAKDQGERREYVETAKAMRRIGHLIESGYLPRQLADDLQRLLNRAMMWEMSQKAEPED